MNRTLFLPAFLISMVLVLVAGTELVPASEPTAQAAGLAPARFLPTSDVSEAGRLSEPRLRSEAYGQEALASTRRVPRNIGSHDVSGEAGYNDGTWHIETVDSKRDTGLYTSLALDGDGYPHISYHDHTRSDLRYAYQNASGWHIETVDSEGDVWFTTSLALDANGYPHISYYNSYPNYNLKYAHQDASGWHIETVDSRGDVGWYTSLALDGSGYPHISYHDYPNHDLKYAHQDASGWHIETVDSEGDVWFTTSLALDANGYPHISYFDFSNDALKYAYKNASGWHIETVDSGGWYTSLALDRDGYPHISYCGLKYAYQNASGWHIQTVGSGGCDYTSLALDERGYPHISYYYWYNGDLKYAYQDTSGWHIEPVDSEGNVGSYTSLALDDIGYPHISYYDSTNGDLKYAYYSSAPPTPTPTTTPYWKPGDWGDYAPNGMPDFDQRQDQWDNPPGSGNWSYCGPLAVANCLWWFDSKMEPYPAYPPAINDHHPMVESYLPSQWDDHDPTNLRYFVEDLAYRMDTDGQRTGGTWGGTYVTDMFYAILQYLADKGLAYDYSVTLVEKPSFEWVGQEVERCEDVILLLGYWAYNWDTEQWERFGGHFVTMAGVDSHNRLVFFSDPIENRAEEGWPGRVQDGTLIPHYPVPGHTSDVHNDAGNISHDEYHVVETDSPGGTWGPDGYADSYETIEPFVGLNFPHDFSERYRPKRDLSDLRDYDLSGIQTEVEYAIAISPEEIATPTHTPTSTRTQTPTHTATPTPTRTATSTPTNTPTPTRSNTPTITSTPTSRPTPTPTITPTSTPTSTPTVSPTPTDTPTPPYGSRVFLPLILKHYPPCDPYEPNNSPPGWGPLVSGHNYQAKLCWGDDEDYYHFTITSLDNIVIHLDVPATVDYHMWLYHESDTAYPVGSSANIGKGVDEHIDYTPTMMGTYYIRIRPRLAEDHDDVNPYTLVASFR